MFAWFPRGRLMRVTGHSMTPSLKPGELVVVDQRAYAGRDPRRDEMVAARPQACGGRALVKRIAGLPNEEVQVAGTRWRLGPDEFFLLGEQAGDSADSRQFGPVRRHELLGPVRPLRPSAFAPGTPGWSRGDDAPRRLGGCRQREAEAHGSLGERGPQGTTG